MFITVGDATIYATSFGPRTAPAMLALSGWIGSWEDWADTLSVLSDGWHTISYDHRGSGATIAPVESITFERLVDDVFAVLDALAIERCLLAAMSMGATVALAAALKQPQRFSGLVIVNGAYYRDPVLGSDLFMQGLESDYSNTLDRFVKLCVPEDNSDPIKRWGRQILDRASQEAAIALYRLGGAVDLRNDLDRITLPSLIIHGDADPLVSLESSEWLARTLPNAELAVIAGAGHVPIMTRPQEVARLILGRFE